MNTQPQHAILPDTEATLRVSLTLLHKPELKSPAVDTAVPVLPPAEDSSEGWYEP